MGFLLLGYQTISVYASHLSSVCYIPCVIIIIIITTTSNNNIAGPSGRAV